MNESAPTEPVSLPRLNERAPEFSAMTTQGQRSLKDYEGRWLVLFSHPADFTPVCTTEFMSFAKAHDQFQAIGCDLLGLSIDSIHAHVAWIRNIKEKFGVDIPFPVIADISMQVANQFGMIHPGASNTQAVRAVFVIDPQGVLRAMIYYPLTNGRSIAEIIRLVQSLQTTAEHGVATPEAWQPGDKVIVPPPSTAEAAEKRLNEGYECTDWYFCKKDL